MDRQLLITYLDMKARMRSLETVADNLANASTKGFKAEIDYQQSLEEGDPVWGQGQPTQQWEFESLQRGMELKLAGEDEIGKF